MKATLLLVAAAPAVAAPATDFVFRATVKGLAPATTTPVEVPPVTTPPVIPPVEIPLTSSFALVPATLTFEPLQVGERATRSVVLNNTGTAVLPLPHIDAPAGVSSQAGSCTHNLAPQESCSFDVLFNPTAAGNLDAPLTVRSGAVAKSVHLAGTAVAPSVDLSTGTLDFGSVLLGEVSSAKAAALMNSGKGPVTLQAPTVEGPFEASHSCAESLAPADGCIANVVFKPATPGPVQGTLSFASSAGNHTVALSGTALAGLVVAGASRTWVDNSVARSCLEYRQGDGMPSHLYWGATGNGVYRIDPDGAGARPPLDVYCDMVTDGGGWTLVMTNNLPNFANTAATGTSKVCLTTADCNTGGTSDFYRDTPVEATLTQFLFTATNTGNPYQHMSRMESPANFIRDTTPAPGISLYRLMTDTTPGWAPAANEGIVEGGDRNSSERMFGSANGITWSDGNWHGYANQEGMQLRTGLEWGHHHFTKLTFDGTNYVVGPWTFLPFHGGAGDGVFSQHTAENLMRWMVLVR